MCKLIYALVFFSTLYFIFLLFALTGPCLCIYFSFILCLFMRFRMATNEGFRRERKLKITIFCLFMFHSEILIDSRLSKNSRKNEEKLMPHTATPDPEMKRYRSDLETEEIFLFLTYFTSPSFFFVQECKKKHEKSYFWGSCMSNVKVVRFESRFNAEILEIIGESFLSFTIVTRFMYRPHFRRRKRQRDSRD